MKKPIYKRKRFWGLILLIVFFLSLTISNYLTFWDNKYVGEVVAISATWVTLVDGKTWRETLSITDTTLMSSWDISIGDRIMVISSRDATNLEAQVIRLLHRKIERGIQK